MRDVTPEIWGFRQSLLATIGRNARAEAQRSRCALQIH
ncbi:hypothetical protein CYA_1499 [Synechococcus sp. JA-3-3Ab]|nr:hypothetical protein CYA_1499 [Synechococcus sp. JA-3-3Ab]